MITLNEHYTGLYILVRGSSHPGDMVVVVVVPCLGPASYVRQAVSDLKIRTSIQHSQAIYSETNSSPNQSSAQRCGHDRTRECATPLGGR